MHTYEVAVYSEECEDLVRDILSACSEALKIKDVRVRVAIIGAALLTAAQMIDGHPDSTQIKHDGVMAAMAATLSAKTVI